MNGIWTPELYSTVTIVFILTVMARSILSATWTTIRFRRDLRSRR